MKTNEQESLQNAVAAVGKALLVLAILALTSLKMAAAQSAPTPEPFFGEVFVTKDGKTARRGDSCRPPRPGAGIVKVDACGRWYCGNASVKDLIEARPNLAAEVKCTWVLKDETCRCVK